jgi:CubicO group peptidase (beta-lactamase class C family)
MTRRGQTAAALFFLALAACGRAYAQTPVFPPCDPAAVGVDPAALAQLQAAAQAAHSSSVVIVKDHRLVADWEWDHASQPIQAMSATKSVVNLAIGRLIDTGRIGSLDEPVSDWYPEWNQGEKKLITLRMLLNHTSGLQANPTAEEIYASSDYVRLALNAPLSSDPGTHFFYNNKAVNLLAGIVQKSSGEKMDALIGKEIFAPLGIVNYSWDADASGNPAAMAGLHISAMDFAKIGQMMLNGGTWHDHQIISKNWITQSVAAGQSLSPECGLLWWRLSLDSTYVYDPAVVASWRQVGMPQILVDKAQTYLGKSLDRAAYAASIIDIFGSMDNAVKVLTQFGAQKPAKTVLGPVIGYYADGYLGQYMMVIPSENLVAVRMIDRSDHATDSDDFSAFLRMAATLVPQAPPASTGR